MQKDWTKDTITIHDDIELFYTRTGGDKPKIVLLHGITDQGSCWNQFASDLEANYDLVMVDAYGHGKSSRIDPDQRFDMVEDLHDFITALEIEKPGIIGHSMGAATAAGYAAKYPDNLAALVLEDPPWSDAVIDKTLIKSTLQEWKNINLSAKGKSTKELISWKRKESPNWEDAVLPEWAQSKLDVDPAVFDHYPIPEKGWRELAKAITVPTLIVTGDNELGAVVTPKLGIEAVTIIDRCEFGHISRAGHCVHYEQYQPYLTMVKLFLKRNLPA